MHPTGISVPLIDNLPLAATPHRRVMPGVMPFIQILTLDGERLCQYR
jgi:hypothetical protein